MTLGFVAGAKRGQHFELVDFAISKLKGVNLLVKRKAVLGYLENVTV